MASFGGSKFVIVKEEDEGRFAERVAELFEEGFRPAADFKAFADWDEEEKAWKTLYAIPLIKMGEGSDVAEGGALEARRMFG